MAYKNLYYLYACYHCGKLHYSRGKIKKKKCLNCNRSFSFENAEKMKVMLTSSEIVGLLQYLKKLKFESANFNLKEEILKLKK